MNTFLNELKNDFNVGLTENGSVKYNSTMNAVLDMFGMGGSYRNRSDEDCILLFKNAYEEDAELALKCFFYLGDIRGGQGERRFFRICFHWLANEHPEAALRNLNNISEYRRYDDLIYSCLDTPIEEDMLKIIKHQLALDIQSDTPSLLGKWLPSLNASSKITKKTANILRNYLGMTNKEYRKTLSELRARIKVLEKTMSQGDWNDIDFSKIPSRAGLIYRNAFSNKEATAERYKEFMKNKKNNINAGTLYPVDIAHRAFSAIHLPIEDPTRLMLQKAWDNLPNYYNGREENGLCVVDVSGSMYGTPLEVAVSLGAYIAERGHGPFANHFITFSKYPQLVKFEGVDIADKFIRCQRADWGFNTNLEAVFDLLLDNILKKNVKTEDIPNRLYILSDMEFDSALGTNNIDPLIEEIAQKWSEYGYELPHIIFWNLAARNNNIPGIYGKFSYVSGFSPSILKAILSEKSGWDLCLETLLSERYKNIH